MSQDLLRGLLTIGALQSLPTIGAPPRLAHLLDSPSPRSFPRSATHGGLNAKTHTTEPASQGGPPLQGTHSEVTYSEASTQRPPKSRDLLGGADNNKTTSPVAESPPRPVYTRTKAATKTMQRTASRTEPAPKIREPDK